MSDKKKGLYQKISKVMRDVAYLSKDDNIEFKSTKYKAISEEKVTSAVRTAMLEHGLIIIPIEQEHKRVDTLSTVDTKYKIIDIETGEYEVIVSSGSGVDTQDKGVGKAMTYAFKYLLLRTFAIPTGEDPDKISSAELDAKQAEEKNKAETKLKNDIKIKWIALGGKEENLEPWIDSQSAKGVSLNTMHSTLAKRAVEKETEKKETK